MFVVMTAAPYRWACAAMSASLPRTVAPVARAVAARSPYDRVHSTSKGEPVEHHVEVDQDVRVEHALDDRERVLRELTDADGLHGGLGAR